MPPAQPEVATRELPAIVGGTGTAAAVLLAAMLLALGWANWPSADDFCNTVLVKDGGIAGAMRWLYTQWSGRVFTGLALYTTFALIDIPFLRMVSVLLAAVFVACAWQVGRFVMPPRTAVPAWVLAFVLTVLTGGLYPLLGQVVYWPTGGIVYLVPLLLLLHWLDGMRRLVDDGVALPGKAYWFAISVMLGNSIELVVPIAAAYLAMVAYPRWREMASAARTSLLLRTGGLVVGTLVLVTAPGNFLRGNATPGSFALDPTLLVHEYVRVLSGALRTGALVVAAAAGLVLAAVLLRMTSPGRAASPSPRGREAAALVIGGLASLLPVLAAPLQFAPRNGLYLLVCLLLAALLIVSPALQREGRAPMAAIAAMVALAFAGALLLAARLAGDHELAALRRTQHLVRDAFLRDAARRGTDVTLEPIRPYPPVTLHAIDVSPDTLHIVNQCVARYYDLASVRLGARSLP